MLNALAIEHYILRYSSDSVSDTVLQQLKYPDQEGLKLSLLAIQNTNPPLHPSQYESTFPPPNKREREYKHTNRSTMKSHLCLGKLFPNVRTVLTTRNKVYIPKLSKFRDVCKRKIGQGLKHFSARPNLEITLQVGQSKLIQELQEPSSMFIGLRPIKETEKRGAGFQLFIILTPLALHVQLPYQLHSPGAQG